LRAFERLYRGSPIAESTDIGNGKKELRRSLPYSIRSQGGRLYVRPKSRTITIAGDANSGRRDSEFREQSRSNLVRKYHCAGRALEPRYRRLPLTTRRPAPGSAVRSGQSAVAAASSYSGSGAGSRPHSAPHPGDRPGHTPHRAAAGWPGRRENRDAGAPRWQTPFGTSDVRCCSNVAGAPTCDGTVSNRTPGHRERRQDRGVVSAPPDRDGNEIRSDPGWNTARTVTRRSGPVTSLTAWIYWQTARTARSGARHAGKEVGALAKFAGRARRTNNLRRPANS
jgi:hypothetical protein